MRPRFTRPREWVRSTVLVVGAALPQAVPAAATDPAPPAKVAPPLPAEPTPVEPVSFKHAGVTDAWAAYAGKLSFGKGQTLALLDDGCQLSLPELTATVDGVPKVLVSYRAGAVGARER